MKDNIILSLWVVYTLGFSALSSQEEDLITSFIASALFAQILLGIYLILTTALNIVVNMINYRIKLPPLKFKSKVTPIYKIEVYEEVKRL